MALRAGEQETQKRDRGRSGLLLINRGLLARSDLTVLVPDKAPYRACYRVSNMLPRLDTFKADVHSQNGEDGVIAEIIRRTRLVVNRDFWCVEFGAWDGIFLSNTFALVETYSATAVMIEGDRERFGLLEETAEKFPSIIPVEGFVTGEYPPNDSLLIGPTSESDHSSKVGTLDELLSGTSCPEDYDLLSIDIDSYDLEVWDAHRAFKPKIVVIEINSGLEPGILQWHGDGAQYSSFSSTLAVGHSKGYTLVCHTGNMIFLRDDLVDLVEMDGLDRRFPERLFYRGFLPSNPQARNPAVRLFRKVMHRILGI